jgi:hypothetical protein
MRLGGHGFEIVFGGTHPDQLFHGAHDVDYTYVGIERPEISHPARFRAIIPPLTGLADEAL